MDRPTHAQQECEPLRRQLALFEAARVHEAYIAVRGHWRHTARGEVWVSDHWRRRVDA